MVTAAYIAGDFVVIGVLGFHLWRGRHVEFAKPGFSLAMWIAIILTPLQIFLGDLHGRNSLAYQPVKVAAMEGDWETQRGQPLVLFAWPDMAAQRNLYEVAIPKLGSLILTHSWDGMVTGIKSVPPDEQPPVPFVFFAFRLMVGIGVVMFLIALGGLVLRLMGPALRHALVCGVGGVFEPVSVPRHLERLDGDRGRAAALHRLWAPADGRRGFAAAAERRRDLAVIVLCRLLGAAC